MAEFLNKKVIEFRNEVCKKKNIELIKVFDTNEHEPFKDVILGKWQGKKIVLRVGEHRPVVFFKKGYIGKNLIIPQNYFLNIKEKYEIEEYLNGELLSDLFKKPAYNKLFLNNFWLEKLIKAHWEFQKITKNIKLKNKIKKREQIFKYFKIAKRNIINKELISSCEEKINNKKYLYFWNTPFPFKWKYSQDNLIATPDKKIGYIDLCGVGKRYWGYDLGWMFWPQWFYFSESNYGKVKEHFKYLVKFFQLVYKYAPEKERKNVKKFNEKCQLVLFERIIGGIYDISANISHTKKMSSKKKKLMLKFLNKLLKINLDNI